MEDKGLLINQRTPGPGPTDLARLVPKLPITPVNQLVWVEGDQTSKEEILCDHWKLLKSKGKRKTS